MSLNQYFWTNQGEPINKWLQYLPVYERYFSRYRDRRIMFLEIGTGQGGSSRMWKHYFGPAAQIVSVDIREECRAFADEQIAIRIGDQSDAGFLQSIVDEFGHPDIVLDDGSHQTAHVNATFDFLYPNMPREALYVVEDTHASYWPRWGGGLGVPATFIERMKRIVDELHAGNPHNKAQIGHDLPCSEIGRLTRAVHFYDSIVVVEKGAFLVKQSRSIPHVPGQKIW